MQHKILNLSRYAVLFRKPKKKNKLSDKSAQKAMHIAG